ncbi:MAG: hypothetical protein FJ211_10115 [Ignavibacteria bacterium]|nr:hypothetical protein [Ignavibacteria bacterium]
MCSGQRQHHRNEEAKREANRQAVAFENALKEREKANMAIVESLKPKYTPPPASSGASMMDKQGVQRKRTRKSSVIDASKGVASLRIPLNTGGSSGYGPNMG